MKLLAWVKQMLGKADLDYVDAFPSKLKTDTRGILIARFTDLRCNGKLLSRSCRYESHAKDGRVAARFTPDDNTPANVALWKQVFDQRLLEFEQNWAQILNQKAPRLETRLTGWLPAGVSIHDFIKSLKPRLIAIEASGVVRLVFENSPILQHHDLTVDFGRENNIKDVTVEG